MKFTEEHEWLRIEDDIVVVGITEHASTQLGDIVFVELPEEGQTLSKDDEAAVIESWWTISNFELYLIWPFSNMRTICLPFKK